MKYKVMLENFERVGNSACGVVYEKGFDSLSEARAAYEAIDGAAEYSRETRADKKRYYLAKSLVKVKDDDFCEFIESESAGKHFADDYTMYEVEREGERVFMSIEICDGAITLRETKAGDEDFEDVERWHTDRDWDSTLLTDGQYEALLDNIRIIDER